MPGTPTPYYGFPIPAYIDAADAPHDFQALAQKIEDTLKNGYRMQGDLTMGDATTANARVLILQKLEAPDAMQGQMYIMTGGALVLNLFKAGVEVNRLRILPDGSLAIGISQGVVRPIPFATSAGQATITISTAAVIGSVVVTFPASRFTQTPIVTCSCANAQTWVGSPNPVSATQFTCWVRHIDNAANTGTMTVNWIAMQMTPTSTPGSPAMVRTDGLTHTSTCHTDGCENHDIAITGPWEEGYQGVVCGACSQPIVDTQIQEA